MGKKWDPRIVENVMCKSFDEKRYNQILDELAEIIYSELCQLTQIDSKSEVFNFKQRTGSHD